MAEQQSVRPNLAQPPNIRLSVASTPENVVLVRAVLSGVAEDARLNRNDLNDVRTAVSEACNNVVLHAYGGAPGTLEVELGLAAGSLCASVCDRGVGMSGMGDRPAYADRFAYAAHGHTQALGLHIIHTLARAVEFDEPAGGGTCVRMEFAVPGSRRLESFLDPASERPEPVAVRDSEALVSISPTSLARGAISWLASAMAARAHFSTDRISDLQMLLDALAAHAPLELCAEQLIFGVRVAHSRTLDLHLGPFAHGGAQALIRASALDGLGGVVEKLADGHAVVRSGLGETLTLSLLDRRGLLQSS